MFLRTPFFPQEWQVVSEDPVALGRARRPLHRPGCLYNSVSQSYYVDKSMCTVKV